MTRSKVKVTTGGCCPGLVDLPVKTTVSPLNTDFTMARPDCGRIARIAGLATGIEEGRDMVIANYFN